VFTLPDDNKERRYAALQLKPDSGSHFGQLPVRGPVVVTPELLNLALELPTR
jgi:hypothetical protein